jgi:hypothetical protein
MKKWASYDNAPLLRQLYWRIRLSHARGTSLPRVLIGVSNPMLQGRSEAVGMILRRREDKQYVERRIF